MSPELFFANYTKRTSARPKTVWQVLRVLTLLVTLVFAALLALAPGVGLKPVSYTHLDVYKRQGLDIARSQPIDVG